MASEQQQHPEQPQASEGLDQFLVRAKRAAKAIVADPSSEEPIRVVLGNEAADLDSFACSLAYAFVLTKTTNTVHVPVINVERQDLPLRTDVVHLCKKLHLPISEAIFIDEIDLLSLYQQRKLKVTLVDHNRLSVKQKSLQNAVERIVDHHEDEGMLASVFRRVEKVGSCSSLVAIEALKAGVQLCPKLAELLLGAILIDSINLDVTKGRTEPLDEEAASKLLQLSGLDSQEVFERLHKARFDVSNLGIGELLKRDYKQVTVGPVTVGLPAITLPLNDIFAKPNVDASLNELFEKRNIAFACILTAFQDSSASFCRQLCLIAPPGPTSQWLHRVADRVKERVQSLRAEDIAHPNIVLAFQQADIKLSRKAILPCLVDCTKSIIRPDNTCSVKVIGVTGMIGAGKSTLCKILETKFKAHVFNSDKEAHKVYGPGTLGLQQVVAAFGRAILDPSGHVDRRKLATIVFGDEDKMAQLTSIVWPVLAQRILDLRLELESQADGSRPLYLVIEAAALLQAGWKDLCHAVWLVDAPRESIAHRLQQRGMTEEAAARRMVAQADFFTDVEDSIDARISNGTSLQELEAQVAEALEPILKASLAT